MQTQAGKFLNQKSIILEGDLMNDWTLIAAAISGIFIVAGLIMAFVLRKKKTQGKTSEPDYLTFFILGICFIPLGLVFMLTINNPGFLAVSGLGVIYIALGLKNKSKWKK
jgi:nitrate reductase gamma subunit